MAVKPTPIPQVHASSVYNFLYGRFALGDYSIPYLVVSMRLSDAARELKIPEEATPVGLRTADLEELYQRDVDWGRVLSKIVPYLENERRPQFFNALTVVMLPYRDREFIPFTAPDLIAPSLDGEFPAEQQLEAGPIRIGAYGDLNPKDEPHKIQLGKICWNRDQVRCIAIDGQHRLGALKHLENREDPRLDESYITVLLVIPSESVGYVAAEALEDQVRLMRALFTDLNKHAVKVSRSREILLDDYDPQSLCVRRVVQSTLEDAPPNWIASDPTRVPLVLVDWHSDEAKFDDGPYVTTMLVLDQIVGSLLGIKPIRDWTDEDEVRRQITALQRIGWEPSDQCTSRLEAVKESGQPFSYPQEDLDGIVDAFASRWAPSLAYLLMQSEPYENFIDWRRSCRTLTADFVLWFHAFERHEKGRNDRTLGLLQRMQDYLLEQTPPAPIAQWTELSASEKKKRSGFHEKKKESLFFKVVFQKALFYSVSFLAGLPRSEEDPDAAEERVVSAGLQNAWEVLDEDGRLTFLWILDCVSWQRQVTGDLFTLDHRTAVEPFDTFWLGTVARADVPETIDFTNAAASRASFWLSLGGIFAYGLREKPELRGVGGSGIETFDELLDEVFEGLPRSVRRPAGALADQLYGNRQGRAMRRIVQAERQDLDPEDDESKSLREEHFFRRARHLWETLRASFES